MKRLIMLVVVIVSAVVGTASAAPAIDQQQPVIGTDSAGVFAIGGITEAKQVLAQVVTPGVTGNLTEVRLAGSCWDTPLTVEVQGVKGGVPNGTVLGSQTSLFKNLPDTAFNGIVFATPVPVHVGVPYAIVLSTSGSCSTWPGPLGDPYPGGNAFARNQFDPPGVWYPVSIGYERSDLPFQTLVDAKGATEKLRLRGVGIVVQQRMPVGMFAVDMSYDGVTATGGMSFALPVTYQGKQAYLTASSNSPRFAYVDCKAGSPVSATFSGDGSFVLRSLRGAVVLRGTAYIKATIDQGHTGTLQGYVGPTGAPSEIAFPSSSFVGTLDITNAYCPT